MAWRNPTSVTNSGIERGKLKEPAFDKTDAGFFIVLIRNNRE